MASLILHHFSRRVKFILAEAAMKNWINTGTSAKQYYDAGITANFAQWGIDMPAGFLDLPAVSWNNTLPG
jgi:hypothetical protein